MRHMPSAPAESASNLSLQIRALCSPCAVLRMRARVELWAALFFTPREKEGQADHVGGLLQAASTFLHRACTHQGTGKPCSFPSLDSLPSDCVRWLRMQWVHQAALGLTHHINRLITSCMDSCVPCTNTCECILEGSVVYVLYATSLCRDARLEGACCCIRGV
jgi:hypothetical protein